MYVHTKICIWMFKAALFIIDKNLKQPTCPSVDEWTNLGSWFSIKKKKWVMNPCSDIICILLSEWSQSGKAMYCIIPTICHSTEEKIMETVRSVVVRDPRGRKKGWLSETHIVLRQWIYSVWHHNSGYIPLYICQNQ